MEKFFQYLTNCPALRGYKQWLTRPVIIALCCYTIYSVGKSVGEAVYYLLH